MQKTLKQLRTDCVLLDDSIQQRLQQDAANRQLNHTRSIHAAAFTACTLLVLLLLAGVLASHTAGAVCSPSEGYAHLCSGVFMRDLLAWDETLDEMSTAVLGGLVTLLLVCGGGVGFAWRGAPVMDRRQHKRMGEYRAALSRAKQEADVLWEEYFASISHAGDR